MNAETNTERETSREAKPARSCCSAEEKEVCCAPEAKASCCAPSGTDEEDAGGCGCR